MRRYRKSANPFYVLLVLAGISFVLTATAYGVMAFRDVRPPAAAPPAQASSVGSREHPLMLWMSRHGEAALLIELGFLAFFTFAAMGTDGYWQRRANPRPRS